MNNKDKYYNYYPSLDAYTNQNKWMEYMTSPDSYYLKVIDYRTKTNLNYRYDNLFKKSLNNICGDFGCVSGNVGEDIDHIRGKYGGSIYMPTKCLQSKEYSSPYNMNRDFNELYSKSSDEAKKIYEENLKEAKKEAESENDEKLEEEASSLIAHGEFIQNKVKAAKELGRYIRGIDLLAYVIPSYTVQYYIYYTVLCTVYCLLKSE